MDRLIEFMSSFYWPYLPLLLINSLRQAEWQDALQRAGFRGLCGEAISSLIGSNSHAFFVPMNGGWSHWRIGSLLKKHGISMWGNAFHNGEMFFYVKKQQAAWAQYVLLREGVPLREPLIAEGAKPTSDQPQNKAKQKPESLRAQLEPLERGLNRLLDAIEHFDI